MILQLSLIKKTPQKTCNCAGGVGVETATFAVFDLQLCRSSVDLNRLIFSVSERNDCPQLDLQLTGRTIDLNGLIFSVSERNDCLQFDLQLTGRSVDLNGKNAWYLTPRVTPNTPNLLPVPTIICGHPSIFPPPFTKKKWVCKLCFQHCGGVRGARLGISSTSVSSANNCRDR